VYKVHVTAIAGYKFIAIFMCPAFRQCKTCFHLRTSVFIPCP